MSLALDEGFSNAEVTQTDKIVFDERFRPYCEENLCGQYGVNYSCPPTCGTPEEMKQRVLSYKKALFVKTEWDVPELSDNDKLKHARNTHNAMMFAVIKKLRASGHDGFMIGASGCVLCQPCVMPTGQGCRYPELRYSCMSAYCIHVKALAEVCGMTYDYKNGILPFFGTYIFN